MKALNIRITYYNKDDYQWCSGFTNGFSLWSLRPWMNFLSLACLATFTFMLSNNSWCIIWVSCVWTHHQSCDYHRPLKGILLWNISCWVFWTVLFHRCSLDSYLAIYNLLPDISLQPHISQPHHDYDCSCFSSKGKHSDDWNVRHIFSMVYGYQLLLIIDIESTPFEHTL